MIEILFMIILAIIVYTIIGCIPGTDETSVLYPISFALILNGVKLELVFAFFMASIVTLNLMNLIPTMLLALPGGVMSSPMIDIGLSLKINKKSSDAMKKMAISSFIAVILSYFIALLFAKTIAPLAKPFKEYSGYFFICGAIFLSLMSKNKIMSLLSIIPIGFLFAGIKALYINMNVLKNGVMPSGSFFLAITVGPLIVSLFELLNIEKLKSNLVQKYSEIIIPKQDENSKLKLHTIKNVIFYSAMSCFLFFLSPVAILIMSKETVSIKNNDNENDKNIEKVCVMSALAQSTYISGIIISLLGLGFPISPAALGPAQAFFKDGKSMLIDLNFNDLALYGLIAIIIASIANYLIIKKYIFKITTFVIKYISHESVLALFISLVLLIAFIEGGFINIIGVLLIAFVLGNLYKCGVNYGVMFMSFYASSFIITYLTK